MALQERISALIEDPLKHLGYRLVRAKITGTDRVTVQIMIDRLDKQAITVKDCSKVSYEISAIFDVHDPVTSAYHLEVSSPGINRPLITLDDFANYKDCHAKIYLHESFQGAKRLKGLLQGVQDGKIAYWPDHHKCDEPILIDLDEIASAELIITDFLLDKLKPQMNNS